MELPSPTTAPQAIRALGAILRKGVLHARTSGARKRRTTVLHRIISEYNEAPDDEFTQHIHRASRDPGEPERTYYFKGPDLDLVNPETYGYDRIAAKKRRITKRVFPLPPRVDLPPSWDSFFFDRIAYPPEKPSPGRHPFRLFLMIKRADYTLEVPVHDAKEPWQGASMKARPPYSFPIDPGLPYLSYFVFGDKLSSRSLQRWITIYLAQRLLLTKMEEECAIQQFFLPGSEDWRSARLEAYFAVKDKFAQPIAGRPSFPTYLQRTTRSLMRDSWRNERPVKSDTSLSPLVSLQSLRNTEPNLYTAVMYRIRGNQIETVHKGDDTFVWREIVARIDEERKRNAEIRQQRKFSAVCRSRWINALMKRGISRESARRKLARWINEYEMSRGEIEQSIVTGKLVREV